MTAIAHSSAYAIGVIPFRLLGVRVGERSTMCAHTSLKCLKSAMALGSMAVLVRQHPTHIVVMIYHALTSVYISHPTVHVWFAF